MDQLKDYILEQLSNKNIDTKKALNLLKDISNKETKTANIVKEYAIVGMSGRFPGAPNLETFWDNLNEGKDSIIPYPNNRINDVTHISKEYFEKMKDSKFRPGGYLKRIDLFDAEFFNITPAEARLIDPNQRFFLEVAWEALENGGYSKEQVQKISTGVYVGHSMENKYKNLLDKSNPMTDIGNMPSMISSRVSYHLNLRGPSMTIDTTCSSSLVAVHVACRALKDKECDLAIAGGVNVGIFPIWDEMHIKGHESSDGRCKAFDASANGTNYGEGVGVILIRRLEDAIRDNDYIYAVIKGSAINNDGFSNGITAPNPKAQTDVITKSWENADVLPETINYIEAHGTGTKLGDPIEIQGISNAFEQYVHKKEFIPIGSVKTNIGHLDAAAGIASLIKTVLCIKNQKIPPSINFKKKNPFIDFENSPVYVNRELQEWKEQNTPRRAGISSFGMSGTNCHIVIEDFKNAIVEQEETHTMLFSLSGRTKRSVLQLARKYKKFLKKESNYHFFDIINSVNRGREHHEHRIAILASNLEELTTKISRISAIGEFEHFPNLDIEDIYYRNLEKNKTIEDLPILKKIKPKDVSSLLEAYLLGYNIDWEYYYEGKSYNKVPFPPSLFNPIRYWPNLEVVKKINAKSVEQLLYDLTWTETNLNSLQKKYLKPGGLWLVLTNNTPLSKNLIDRIQLEKQKVIVIHPATQYKKISETEYCINPLSIEDYYKLSSNLGDQTLKEIVGVLHMWTCQGNSEDFKGFNNLDYSQALGVYSLFYLTKTLLSHKLLNSVQFNVITDYVYKVDGNEQDIFPNKATLIGFAKVISQEFTNLATYAIDIDTEAMKDNDVIDFLIDEISIERGHRDECIAYRSNKRFIQTLKRLEVNRVQKSKRNIKRNGVYIIAGAGYLGIEVAKFMATKEKVKIILLNRTSLPPRSQWNEILKTQDENSRLYCQLEGIKEIERLGSEVLYIPTDLSKERDVSLAIKKIKESYGEINGLLLTSKEIYGKTIEEITEFEFKNAIEGKVYAGWYLDKYTVDEELDFFINFASISSIMAGPKNCDCTSVNTFLDSFADYRQMNGRKTLTLNITEIFTGERIGKVPERTMIPPMEYKEFISCFEYILSSDLDYVVITDFDMEVLNVVLPVIKINFDTDLLQEIQNEKINSSTLIGEDNVLLESTDSKSILEIKDVEAMLQDIWEEVLGYKDIKPKANFFELGGTSLSAVKLMRLISLNFNIKFEVADMYAYASFEDMCTHIFKKIKNIDKSDELLDLLESLSSDQVSVEEAMKMLESIE